MGPVATLHKTPGEVAVGRLVPLQLRAGLNAMGPVFPLLERVRELGVKPGYQLTEDPWGSESYYNERS